MKVKLKKSKNYYQLVVDDTQINKKYDCTQSEPVVLAVLESWEGTQCWSLRDLRLEEHIFPSQYLEGSSIETFIYKNEEEAKLAMAVLNHYEKREDRIVWNSFNGIVGGGDKTNDPNNPSYVAKSMQSIWSFDKGLKKFNEIREFWENFEGDDIESTKQPNPFRQPFNMVFTMLSIMLDMSGKDIDKSPKEIVENWQKLYKVDQSIIDSIDYEKLMSRPNDEEKIEEPEFKRKNSKFK